MTNSNDQLDYIRDDSEQEEEGSGARDGGDDRSSSLLLAGPAKPAHAAFPGQNGKIAFTSTKDQNPEIYTTDPDGFNQKRLTFNSANDFDPAVSPDGKKIAFVSQRGRTGEFEVFVMNAKDGSRQKSLTGNVEAEFGAGSIDWGVAARQ